MALCFMLVIKWFIVNSWPSGQVGTESEARCSIIHNWRCYMCAENAAPGIQLVLHSVLITSSFFRTVIERRLTETYFSLFAFPIFISLALFFAATFLLFLNHLFLLLGLLLALCTRNKDTHNLKKRKERRYNYNLLAHWEI